MFARIAGMSHKVTAALEREGQLMEQCRFFSQYFLLHHEHEDSFDDFQNTQKKTSCAGYPIDFNIRFFYITKVFLKTLSTDLTYTTDYD